MRTKKLRRERGGKKIVPMVESKRVKLPLITAKKQVKGNWLGRKKLRFEVTCLEMIFLSWRIFSGEDTSQPQTIQFSVKRWTVCSWHSTWLRKIGRK